MQYSRPIGEYYSTQNKMMVCKDMEPDALYDRVFRPDLFIGKDVWLDDAMKYWARLHPFLVHISEDYWIVRADLVHKAYEHGVSKELNDAMIDYNLGKTSKYAKLDEDAYELYEAWDGVYQIVYLPEEDYEVGDDTDDGNSADECLCPNCKEDLER